MKLTGRVRRLQARYATNPALVREWTEMLTRLRASFADGAARWPDEPRMNPPVYQVSDAEIAAEARYLASRGTPATLTDWFRYIREVAESVGEGGDDAATDPP